MWPGWSPGSGDFSRPSCNLLAFSEEISEMRKILLVAAATLAAVCQAAYAQDLSSAQFAQATPTAPAAPAAEPAPAAPAPQAAPAAQPAPSAQAAPDAAPTAKASKPAKKRIAKRRSWESDEAKARSIAAKYGVSW
jgi:hypothetical protein